MFVYDAAGQLAAEYSTQIETEAPKVSYLTTDHLGSPRIATNAAGGVISRKDFTAFGEEVFTAQRTSGDEGNGYDPPNVRQDYTGYQKDLESGLEFAQARYYNTRHGRFTSVDPLTKSATIEDPQSFNRYSYVLNKPTAMVDPSGAMGCSAQNSYGNCGGSESFWGGGNFGDGVADLARRTHGGLSRNIARSILRRNLIDDKDIGYDIELERFNDGTSIVYGVDGGLVSIDISGWSLDQVNEMYSEFSRWAKNRERDARREMLEKVLSDKGISGMFKTVRESKEGLIFELDPKRRKDFDDFLKTNFKKGFPSKSHWDQVGCGALGSGCIDFRTDTNTLGIKGSMQITFNDETGSGYVDIDRFGPFTDVRDMLRHTFLEVGSSAVRYPALLRQLGQYRLTYQYGL